MHQGPATYQGLPAHQGLPAYQGPPEHLQHNHEYDVVSPPFVQDGGHQRRTSGGRPQMHGRPRMHVPPAAASRSAEQPAVPSKSASDGVESHSEVSSSTDVILV